MPAAWLPVELLSRDGDLVVVTRRGSSRSVLVTLNASAGQFERDQGGWRMAARDPHEIFAR